MICVALQVWDIANDMRGPAGVGHQHGLAPGGDARRARLPAQQTLRAVRERLHL